MRGILTPKYSVDNGVPPFWTLFGALFGGGVGLCGSKTTHFTLLFDAFQAIFCVVPPSAPKSDLKEGGSAAARRTIHPTHPGPSRSLFTFISFHSFYLVLFILFISQ